MLKKPKKNLNFLNLKKIKMEETQPPVEQKPTYKSLEEFKPQDYPILNDMEEKTKYLNPILKIVSIIVLLSILAFGVSLLYLADNNKFKSEINQPIEIVPIVNSTNQNNYESSSKTENKYQNNFTFKIDIDKELIERFCNNS